MLMLRINKKNKEEMEIGQIIEKHLNGHFYKRRFINYLTQATNSKIRNKKNYIRKSLLVFLSEEETNKCINELKEKGYL